MFVTLFLSNSAFAQTFPAITLDLDRSTFSEHLAEISPYTDTVRLYDVKPNDLPWILNDLKEHKMNVILGFKFQIFLNPENIEKIVKHIKNSEYDHKVSSIIIGEDVIDNGENISLLTSTIRNTQYILEDNGLKIEVSTLAGVDIWHSSLFEKDNKELLSAVDFIFVDYYPYYFGYAPDEAIDHIEKTVLHNIQLIAHDKRIVIETGYPKFTTEPINGIIPEKEMQVLYINKIKEISHIHNFEVVLFSAFDNELADKKKIVQVDIIGGVSHPFTVFFGSEEHVKYFLEKLEKEAPQFDKLSDSKVSVFFTDSSRYHSIISDQIACGENQEFINGNCVEKNTPITCESGTVFVGSNCEKIPPLENFPMIEEEEDTESKHEIEYIVYLGFVLLGASIASGIFKLISWHSNRSVYGKPYEEF